MKNLLKKDRAKGSSDYDSFNYINGILLLQNGEEILMEHRLKQLFSALLAQQNNFVSRSELIDEVWNEVVVDDQSLTKAVSDLRKTLSIQNVENVQIITANKLGYKLIIKATPIKSNTVASKTNILLKAFGYAVVSVMVLIILIRAVRY